MLSSQKCFLDLEKNFFSFEDEKLFSMDNEKLFSMTWQKVFFGGTGGKFFLGGLQKCFS